MTEVQNGSTVHARLPGGVASAQVGPPVMGPPGLRGQRGERGDPGGTTTIVFSFEHRTPDELPETGLIPAGWDDVRVPEAEIQVGVGQSVEYRPDRYLWLFLGPSSVPGGWIETGQMRGPPGDAGPIGDTGPPGPVGERGLTGNSGSPGPKGDPGDTGPQGARGEIGQPGTPGATGPAGPTGSRGDIGPEGPPGPQGDPGPEGPEGPQGVLGPVGPPGEQGDQGDPGAPSFVISDMISRTAGDLSTTAPTGLIPANFDGPGRPPEPYQMKPGEAWLDINPADNPALFGLAIVFCGGAVRQSNLQWIAMTVTGPKGDQGDDGPQGPQGIQGLQGVRGAKWWWSGQAPPPLPAILGAATGDMILCLLSDPAAPGHGDVYDVVNPTIDAVRAGSIRGPAGPQGPKGDPGDVSWVDLFPIVARIDALQARVDKLEAFQLVTMPADIPAPDSVDTVITTIVIPANNEVQGSAHLSFELTDTSGSPRLVTAWIESLGNITITGPSAGQITLHPQLAYDTMSIGPVRAVVGDSAADLVLKVRSDLVGGGPGAGGVVVKAATSIVPGGGGAKPRASGLIAR